MSNFPATKNHCVSSQISFRSFARRDFIRKMTSTGFAAAALAGSGEGAFADAPRPDDATQGPHTFLVTDFGAVGDGKTVRDLEVQSFRTDSPSTTDPAVRMNAVQDVLVLSCRGTAARSVFLEVSGDSSSYVQLSLNRIALGVKEVVLAAGANASAVRKLI
jgi:hypothetical protein